MKTYFKQYIVCILLMGALGFNASAQGSLMPENLIGTDLKKAEAELRRAVERGRQGQTIQLAEVLYYDGQFEEALKYYLLSDSLKLIRTPQHKRNFTHVARMFNTSSPYGGITDYFNRGWHFEARVEPFCQNSPNEDFAPFLWNEFLFVTSSREATRRVYSFTNKPFLNVHVFENGCDPTSIPGFLPEGINSRWHDGPIAISADTTLVIITRNYSQPNQSGFHNLYLEYFVRQSGGWGKGVRFPYATPAFSVLHPYFNNADSTLYYASNLPGGKGGYDLYKSKWNGSRWEAPVNLGPDVNSSFDEVFPSFSPNGDLIYATNHIETMGGLDLVLYRDGVRTLFPLPINSIFDDFALIFKNGKQGYFSSNRTGGVFGDDIFSFEIATPKTLPTEHNYFARVVEKETQKPIDGALVAFSAFDKGISGSILTSQNGEVFIFRSFPGFPTIHFEVSKPGFRTIEVTTDKYTLIDDRMVKTFEMERELSQVVSGRIDPGALSGTIVVYFDNDIPRGIPGGLPAISNYAQTFNDFKGVRNQYFANSASSREEIDAFFRDLENGMKELEIFAEFALNQLRQGEKLMVDLAAFASPLASSKYNVLLSERRNASVKNFFRNWQGGALRQFIDNGSLYFLDKAYGDTKAPANISESPLNRGESVYGVRASRERRVVIFWKRVTDDNKTSAQPDPQPRKYHYIIVGSFNNLQRAELALEEAKRNGADDAGIIPDENGRSYRVFFGRYQKRERALEALNQVRITFRTDAWVLTQ